VLHLFLGRGQPTVFIVAVGFFYLFQLAVQAGFPAGMFFLQLGGLFAAQIMEGGRV
jgi:hypothetical protein